MLRKIIIGFLFTSLLVSSSFASETDVQKSLAQSIKLNAGGRKSLAEIYTRYKSGSYEGALNLIKKLEKNYRGKNKDKLKGLLSYWKGVIYNRLQDFDRSKSSFKKSFERKYTPVDIYYEFAQSLYAMNELKKSRDLFMRSALKGYRPAVCLYYVAFISQTLRDFRLAVKVYRRIERLNDPEKDSVLQASRMQVADIYLTAVSKQDNQVKFLQKRVLSEFENALIFDPDSILSRDIRRKVLKIKDKYGLILLKMRNGRPTIFPRRFIKFTQELGQDSNATGTNPTGQTTPTGSTLYTKSDFYIRRVFYSGNSVSIAPELRANFQYYSNSNVAIKALNNYTYTPALRTTQEHWMWGKPASLLFDFEYNSISTNQSDNGYKETSTGQTFMLGERFNLFKAGESIFRFRYKTLDSTTAGSDNTTKTYSYEQVMNLSPGYILLFLSSYGQTTYETTGMSADSNALTFNLNLITPRLFDYATPTIGLTYTKTDYPNKGTGDPSGSETLLNPSFKLTRVFSKYFRGNLGVSLFQSDSTASTYKYDKTLTTLNVEFLF